MRLTALLALLAASGALASEPALSAFASLPASVEQAQALAAQPQPAP